MQGPRNIPLTLFPEHPCSYLPDRVARMQAFLAADMDGLIYHQLMDAGFRRSGRVIYQMVCTECRLCVPIRVPVERFQPSKSQRRCWRKNQDLAVTIDSPHATEEKFALYQRYQADWHGKDESSFDDFASFLYDSPVQTLEFCYRDSAENLLAVGICDLCPQSLSSVYLYHDPVQSHRGLGTFSALFEIETARQRSIPYWYLGYWVRGCATMDYKATFRPHELLASDGQWRGPE